MTITDSQTDNQLKSDKPAKIKINSIVSLDSLKTLKSYSKRTRENDCFPISHQNEPKKLLHVGKIQFWSRKKIPLKSSGIANGFENFELELTDGGVRTTTAAVSIRLLSLPFYRN